MTVPATVPVSNSTDPRPTVLSEIRAELDRSGEPDPTVIARRVAMCLSAEDTQALVFQALRTSVRVEIRSRRNRGATHDGQGDAAGHGPSRWERFASILDGREFVDGQWKRVADCTADDLDWLADDREKKSAELAGAAARYRGFAAEVRAAGVATFGDLPDAADRAVAA